MEDIKNKLADKEAEQVSGGFREEIDYSGKRTGIGSDDGGAIYNSGSLTIPDADAGWYIVDHLEPATAYAPIQRGWADTDESDL